MDADLQCLELFDHRTQRLDDIHLNAFRTPEMGHELARFTRRVQLLHAPKFATGPDCVASAGDSRVSKCGMSSGFCSYAYCKAQHYPSN